MCDHEISQIFFPENEKKCVLCHDVFTIALTMMWTEYFVFIFYQLEQADFFW
jgi:hypothetical protein